MRNRWSFICFVLLVVMAGCDMNLTDTILLDDREENSQPLEADEMTVSEVPEEVKELIWEDYEAMVEQLLALGEGDTEKLEELLIRIQTRREQDEYYGKYVSAGGIAIVGAKTLTDDTMLEAQEIVEIMTQKRLEVRDYLSPERGFYFSLTDPEYTRHDVKTIPEFPVWKSAFTGGKLVFFNIGMCLLIDGKMVCTATASKKVRIRTTSVGQECSGSWCISNTYIHNWTMLTHEMGHAIDYAAQQFDATFYTELSEAYENAKENDLWIKTKVGSGDYAMKNVKEYWAVATEYWFFNYRERKSYSSEHPDGVIVPAHTRSDLKERDPKIYQLLKKLYPEVEPFGTN